MSKVVFKICTIVLFTVNAFSQAPEKMSYQAVVRNSGDALVGNTKIAMQISILQGSTDGAAIYVETHTPMTNANGLVSIEIGGGELVSGDFGVINWAVGPYYVKIETDPDGVNDGINYTITGTSQLLSVPYALYAKNAGSILGINTHYIGEYYAGGVVFWVDHTGEHGLVVSMVDMSYLPVAWTNMVGIAVGTTNHWDGANNTIAIIEQAGHSYSAAKLCSEYINSDYGTGIYSDWYLPSITELNHIWNYFYEVQKAIILDNHAQTTPILNNDYWSSSEDNSYPGHPFYFSFYLGHSNGVAKKYEKFVRAVRRF